MKTDFNSPTHLKWARKWLAIYREHQSSTENEVLRLSQALKQGRVALVCRAPFQSTALPLSLQQQGFFAPLEWAADAVHIYLLYQDPKTGEVTATSAYDTDKNPPRLKQAGKGDHLHDRDVSAALDLHDRLMYKTEHVLLPPSFPLEKLAMETRHIRALVLKQAEANTLPAYRQEEYDCQTAVKSLLYLSMLNEEGQHTEMHIPLPQSFKGVAWTKKMRKSQSLSQIKHHKALVIQNHDLVGLGNLKPVLKKLGFEIELYKPYYQDAEKWDLRNIIATDYDLLIVLGGTQAAYETSKFPYLKEEERLIKERVKHDLPTLGICLGAQLIAQAMGASTYRGHKQEVGMVNIEAVDESIHPIKKMIKTGFSLPNLHSDTFNLPYGATRLAASESYRNHIFIVGNNTLAIQSHPEVNCRTFCQWIELLDKSDSEKERLKAQATKIDSEAYQSLIQQTWHKWIKSIMSEKSLWEEATHKTHQLI